MLGVGRTAPPGLLGFNTLGFLITGMFAYTMLCVSTGCTLAQFVESIHAGAATVVWAQAIVTAAKDAILITAAKCNLRIMSPRVFQW
jgi:hypothetical protein